MKWGFRKTSLALRVFRKPTSPPLALREGPPLSPSPFPLRVQGMYQPPYSVLKPLRYKVGGPSEVYASSGAAVFFVRDKPQGHGGGAADATAGTWGLLLMGTQGYDEGCSMLIARNLLGLLLMGTQGHNAGCGDDNTFYSTLDRIDSGEVPIRAMAEIL